MAEWSGPWDASDFTESEWRQLFASVFDSGFPVRRIGEADGLVATGSVSNRDITVTPGAAIVQGHLYVSDASIVLNSPAPSGSNQRIDYVALRFDPSEPILTDRIQMVLIQGSEGTNPSPPAVTQDPDGVWEAPRYMFGPHGSGAIGLAPVQVMTAAYTPMQVISEVGGLDEVNARLPGLSQISGALVFNQQDGRIYRYNATTGLYVWTQQPTTGTFGSYSGWGSYGVPYTSRWSLSKDGLVTLQGIRRRTSGTTEIPRGSGDAVAIALLPTNIRMSGSDYSSTFICLASLRYVSSGGTSYHVPVRISHGSDGVLRASAALGSQQLYAHTNSWISLDGISYRV
jgi:hypothetical protein